MVLAYLQQELCPSLARTGMRDDSTREITGCSDRFRWSYALIKVLLDLVIAGALMVKAILLGNGLSIHRWVQRSAPLG